MLKYNNSYNKIGKKEDFKIKYEADDKTDQSQLASASIVEMAKKFGIDAIIAKAEQQNINDTLKDQLYGHDLTNAFKSREDLLNIKKRINNLFENIPARIRKTYFDDNPMNFINAYVSSDEEKLTALNGLGIISDTQLNKVKEYNNQKRLEKEENQKRKEFVTALEKQQGALYETYKQTGTISFNVNKNDSRNSENLQTNI